MKRKQPTTLLIAIALLLSSSLAQAEGTTSTAAQTADPLSKKIKVSYTGWLTGMTYDNPDGRAGTGPDLSIRHTLNLGFKVTPKVKIGVSQHMYQYIRSDAAAIDAQDPKKRTLEMGPLFFKISHAELIKNEFINFTMPTTLAYYYPNSNAYKNSVGRSTDVARGQILLEYIPTSSFGKFTVNMDNLFVYRLAENAPNSREDFYLVFDPGVSYAISSVVEIGMDYSTGRIRHTSNVATGGHVWTKLNKKDDKSQGFEITASITPNKNLSMIPYISWSRPAIGATDGEGPTFQLNKMDIGFIASYNFM